MGENGIKIKVGKIPQKMEKNPKIAPEFPKKRGKRESLGEWGQFWGEILEIGQEKMKVTPKMSPLGGGHPKKCQEGEKMGKKEPKLEKGGKKRGGMKGMEELKKKGWKKEGKKGNGGEKGNERMKKKENKKKGKEKKKDPKKEEK